MKCNSLGKLSKIDILSKQLKIYSIHKKLLTYDYDNDYTTLIWLLQVTKSLVTSGLPTPKFCSEPHISLQGTSWEPKSNMQNHFRTNEKKSILTRKNTFYSTLSARGLYNYSELFPSLGISVSIRF